MTWTQLLASGVVKKHKTSKKELEGIRGIIDRDLADASLSALSTDRRFATAYNAALQTAKMALACAGYRVSATAGHHKASFDCVRIALGTPAAPYADYFDMCRRKRNVIDYDAAHIASETETNEIVKRAKEFFEFVKEWVAAKHPSFKT